MSERRFDRCPVSRRVSGFSVPKISLRKWLEIERLQVWNCETGQNHRRSKGVEPGTRFSAISGRWSEIDSALFWVNSLGAKPP